jgi:serine/threonine-protein kinase
LDEYKTQVLLLHSEQSTLDNLSSGFNDRYTVHCATSGSEALTTLVETPINVIITAHDLPGMSGLDALREAKKRSPDTIGILLAGNKTSDIQALVNDEEVFQVVSGNVTGDGLLQLVDNATRQMRLMALAESANDTTADVDHSAEHIIMETSENGSTIISDGTGRMPVLDPKKVSASVNVGSRSVDVLVLTKDQEFLETIKDSSRGMHKVYYANTLGQANEAIRKHKIGVAVVDAAMVGEKIEQLTEHLRKASPRLVSIVAGRRDDGEMLMDLINRGKVYRFLLKPVSPGRARLAVESSVKHHLEAPDTAFKSKGVAASSAPAAVRSVPRPESKPAPKPAPKPESKPAPPKVAPEAAKPAPKDVVVAPPKSSPAPVAPADPPLGSGSDPEKHSPIDNGLDDPFGQDDSSFTETVTGLISSVGKKFSSDKKADSMPEVPSTNSVPNSTSPAEEDLAGGFGGGGLLQRNPKMLAIGAAAVVIVVAAAFWFMSGSDEPVASPEPDLGTPSFVESDAVFDEAPPATDTIDADALLDEARLARDAGQIFNPQGNNAIELFAASLNADPSNSIIAVELDGVIGQALSMAESAMLESRIDDSAAALQRVAEVDPQNARLPFLTAQLSQMQLRGRLDGARAAIRETRFEDAAAAIAAARNLDVADRSEIDAVVAELAAARSEQQADDVLNKAAARLDSGDLISPANNNARYYYQLVLSNDPENTAARQGLSVIAGKLAFQARTEIDSGNLSAAEDTLASASALDSENSEVASTITALAAAHAAIAQQKRRAEAERQAAAERRANEERQAALQKQADLERQAEAERLAAESQTVDVPEPAENAASEAVTTTADTDADAGLSDDDATTNNTVVDGSATAEASDSKASIEPSTTAPAPVLATIDQVPVAISSLNRIKYVAPKYPRSAQRRNVSGWVDVVFTVTLDGTVKDIDIRNAEPGDTFINAATKAVEKWLFEPVVENGETIEKRAGVRMMFALE